MFPRNMFRIKANNVYRAISTRLKELNTSDFVTAASAITTLFSVAAPLDS